MASQRYADRAEMCHSPGTQQISRWPAPDLNGVFGRDEVLTPCSDLLVLDLVSPHNERVDRLPIYYPVIEALHQHDISVDCEVKDLEVTLGCALEVCVERLADRVVT